MDELIKTKKDFLDMIQSAASSIDSVEEGVEKAAVMILSDLYMYTKKNKNIFFFFWILKSLLIIIKEPGSYKFITMCIKTTDENLWECGHRDPLVLGFCRDIIHKSYTTFCARLSESQRYLIDSSLFELDKALEKSYGTVGNTLNKKENVTNHASELFAFLSKRVIGQEDALKALAVAIHRFIVFNDCSPVLLIGGTGCGKTYLMENIKEYLSKYTQDRVLFLSVDTSNLTPEGYTGKSFSEIATEIIASKTRPGDKAVVFLDEFDKILCHNLNSREEDTNRIVQNQLLTALGGTNTDFRDTLFILGGSFAELEKTSERVEQKVGRIGFTDTYAANIISFKEETIRQKLISFGAIPELVGRIRRCVKLKPLTPEDLVKIFQHEENEVQKTLRAFADMGIEVEVPDATIKKVAKYAAKEGLGARSVLNIFNEAIQTLEFSLYTSNDIQKVILLAGEGEEPIIHYRSKQKKLT